MLRGKRKSRRSVNVVQKKGMLEAIVQQTSSKKSHHLVEVRILLKGTRRKLKNSNKL